MYIYEHVPKPTVVVRQALEAFHVAVRLFRHVRHQVVRAVAELEVSVGVALDDAGGVAVQVVDD